MTNAIGFAIPGENSPGGVGNGDELELFLKVFSGEVLMTWERMNKIRPRVRRRIIKFGKVAQFPAMGKVTASYHTRGENIISPGPVGGPAGTALLSNPDSGEELIYVDKKLVAPVLLDELDDLMAHWELRQEYATEIGRAIAEQDDRQLLQLAILGARETVSTTGDHPLGVPLYEQGMISDPQLVAKGMRVAAQILDENDCPEEGRVAVFRPQTYRLLADSFGLPGGLAVQTPNHLIDTRVGGMGSVAEGKVMRAYGFDILWSNNLPNSNITGTANQHPNQGAGNQNSYEVDASNNVGVCFHRSALGTVQKQGMITSASWKDEYQAWLLMGKQAVGHGILRQGACVELSNSLAGAELGANAVALNTYPG